MKTILFSLLLLSALIMKSGLCDKFSTETNAISSLIQDESSSSNLPNYSNPFEWLWSDYKLFVLPSIIFVVLSFLLNFYFFFIYFGFVCTSHHRLVVDPTI
jgi:hypothetical protein